MEKKGVPIEYVGRRNHRGLHHGYSGFTIEEIHKALQKEKVFQGEKGLKPDVIILMAGTNDLRYTFGGRPDRNLLASKAPAAPEMKSKAPERFLALINDLYAMNPGVTIIVTTLMPTGKIENLKRFKKEEKERLETINKYIAEFNEFLTALPGSEKVQKNKGKLIICDSRGKISRDLMTSRFHPSAPGYRLLAKILGNTFVKTRTPFH